MLKLFQPNIVVDGSGNARITGIGLTKFTRGNGRKSLIYDDEYEPPRWTAPEIFEHDGPDTVESDVYSFGAVAIEVRKQSIFEMTTISSVD